MSKIKNFSINILILLFTLVFFAVIFEVGVRIFSNEGRKIVFLDAQIGTIRKPNSKFQQVLTQETITYRTNSIGFVDDEHEVEKPKDTKRLLFLGDSYTEALQVAFEKNFHQLIEKKYNSLDIAQKIEVMSMGMSGFNTAQELIAYRKYGKGFKPDVVVLMFTLGNDVSGNSSELFYSKTKPFFDVIGEKLVQTHTPQRYESSFFKKIFTDYLEAPRFIYNKANKNPIFAQLFSASHNTGAEKKEDKELSTPDNAVFLSLKNPPLVWQKAWDITIKLIQTIHEETKQNGAQFVFILVPTDAQIFPERVKKIIEQSDSAIDYDLSLSDGVLNKLAQDNHFFYYSLAEALKPLGDNIGIPDGHFSYQAHEIVSEAILNFLKSNNIL